MRASKQFATRNGQSHLPSNMVHVTAEARTVTTPEGTPLVILELERFGTASPTYLRIRMSVDEARALSLQLDLAATNTQ